MKSICADSAICNGAYHLLNWLFTVQISAFTIQLSLCYSDTIL